MDGATQSNQAGALGLLQAVFEELKPRLCFRESPKRSVQKKRQSRLYFTLGPIDEAPVEGVEDGPRCFLSLIFEHRTPKGAEQPELGAYVELISTPRRGVPFERALTGDTTDWRVAAREQVVAWVNHTKRSEKPDRVFVRLINFHRLGPDGSSAADRVPAHDRSRIEAWLLGIDEQLRSLFRSPDHPTGWRQARNQIGGHWPELYQRMSAAGPMAYGISAGDPARHTKIPSAGASAREQAHRPTATPTAPAPPPISDDWPLITVCYSYLPDQPQGLDRTSFYLDQLADRASPSATCSPNRRRYQQITVAQLRSLGLTGRRLMLDSLISEHVEHLEDLDPREETQLLETTRAARIATLRAVRPELVLVQSQRCWSALRPDLDAALGASGAVVVVLRSPSRWAHKANLAETVEQYAQSSLRDRLAEARRAHASTSTGLLILVQRPAGEGWRLEKP